MILSLNKYDKNNNKIYNFKCNICNRNFYGLGHTSKYCNNCFYIKTCLACANKYLFINKDSLVCGKECSGIYFHKQGYKIVRNKEYYKDNNLNENSKINLDIKPFTEINDKNKNDFKGVKVIWFKTTIINNKIQVLDVCITNNILKEIEYHYYVINNKINYKYNQMNQYKDKIQFYYLSDFNNWEEVLIKEFNFTIKTNALY